MKTAIYPGSFDPITNGHLDVIARTHGLFQQVIVSVLHNPDKNPLFSVDERMAMIKEAVRPYGNVSVDSFSGLLVDYAQRVGAAAILRGIRGEGDVDHELRMAHMNRALSDGILTLFVPASPSFAFVSSSLVKEVASHGGAVSAFVPAPVAAALQAKYQNR